MPDEKNGEPEPEMADLDVSLTSVAIQRIIDEVRNERGDGAVPRSYDRIYNRHNR